MKNWLCILVLVSFIRLQFVCCCGAIDLGYLELPACVSPGKNCPAAVERKCECSHPQARQASTERIEAKTACGCQFCDQDNSHAPHLATEHLKTVSSPKGPFESLVAQQSLPIIVGATADFRHSRSAGVSEKCLYNRISILCQFGHLRI